MKSGEGKGGNLKLTEDGEEKKNPSRLGNWQYETETGIKMIRKF